MLVQLDRAEIDQADQSTRRRTTARSREWGKTGDQMHNTRKFGWIVTAGLLGAALIAPNAAFAVATNWATVTGHADSSSDNNQADTWGKDCTKLEEPGGSTYVLGKSYDLVVVKAGSDQSTTYANTLFANATAGETVWADSNGSGAFDEGDKTISHIIFCGPQEEESASVPVESESIPVESASIPVESASIPVESASVPVESESIPVESASIPVESASIPVESASVPVESASIPVESASVPVESASIPVESASVPVESASIPVESTDPSGSVDAETGTPEITPPPTDIAGSANTPSGSGWQLILVGLAALMATALIVTPSRKRR